MKRWLLLSPLLCLGLDDGHAKLRFERTSVVVKASHQTKVLTAKYPFTNDGTGTVKIALVSTSCGCTTATVDKKALAPKEAGTVTVTYQVPIGEGAQSQSIWIATDETPDNTYALAFKAELPAADQTAAPATALVSPRMLFWSRRPFEAKRVKVDHSAMPEAKLHAVGSTADFAVTRVGDPHATEAIFEVVPLPSTANAQGELVVTIEPVTGPKQEHKVPLHVRPPKP